MAGGQAAGVHVRELYRALERQGWRGTLIARPPKWRIAGYLAVLFRTFRLIKQMDVLYVRAHPAALPLLAFAAKRRITTILEINGTAGDLIDAYPFMTRLHGLLTRADVLSIQLVDGVVAVAPGLAEWVANGSGGAVPLAVVPNAADVGRFHRRVPPRLDLVRPYIAYCGALTPWQGIETLIEAACSPAWPDGVRLLVAGDGPLRTGITAAIEAGAPIDYLGVLEHDEIPPILAGSLAAVSARTRRDASPVKLYEALACGIPVIASAVAGQREIVESEGCGLTFPPGDAQELLAAVRRLAADGDAAACMGRRAERASRMHSWDARGAAVTSFIERLRAAAAAAAASQHPADE
jgi:glycosyltransferase involved in cell wall biosynthesis